MLTANSVIETDSLSDVEFATGNEAANSQVEGNARIGMLHGEQIRIPDWVPESSVPRVRELMAQVTSENSAAVGRWSTVTSDQLIDLDVFRGNTQYNDFDLERFDTRIDPPNGVPLGMPDTFVQLTAPSAGPFTLPNLGPGGGQVYRVVNSEFSTDGADNPEDITVEGAVIHPGEWRRFTWNGSLWNAGNANGYMNSDGGVAGAAGQRGAIAILDSGINDLHNAFSERIIYQADVTTCTALQVNITPACQTAADNLGHGTIVAGLAAGWESGMAPLMTDIGVATGANIVAVRVGQMAPTALFVERGLQWVMQNAAAHNIVSVNMSLGGFTGPTLTGHDDNPIGGRVASAADVMFSDELRCLEAMGITVVSAAGNGWADNNIDTIPGAAIPGVEYPASDINSLAVSAVSDANFGSITGNGATNVTTAADHVAAFSDRGALTDVFAPGIELTGPAQTGATGTTAHFHGTSGAAPIVTGAVTIMQQIAQAEMGRRLRLDELKVLLKASGDTINDGDDENDDVRNTNSDFARLNVQRLADMIVDIAADGYLDISVSNFNDPIAAVGNESLRSAIRQANMLGGLFDARITLPAGTFQLNHAEGDLDITGQVTIVGAGMGRTVIDASGLGDRAFEVFGDLSTLPEFLNLDFDLNQDGVADDVQGELFLLGVTVTGGQAAGSGGAIKGRVDSTVRIKNSAIVDNAAGNRGGALFVQGSAIVTNSVIANNNASTDGGGISVVAPGHLEMASTIVAQNTSPGLDDIHLATFDFQSGGDNLIGDIDNAYGVLFERGADQTGISVQQVVTSALDQTLGSNDEFALSLREAIAQASPNDAVVVPAGIHSLTQDQLNVSQPLSVIGVGMGQTVIQNAGNFRVLAVKNNGDLELAGVTITGGQQNGGAGVRVFEGGQLELSSSAVVGNNAPTAGGGGIFVENFGIATIRDSVVTDNFSGHASGGGGIFAVGRANVTLEGSIVAENQSPGAAADFWFTTQYPNANSLGGNLLGAIGEQDSTNRLAIDFSVGRDQVGLSLDHVVTTTRDEDKSADNSYALSLREAIAFANASNNLSVVGVSAGRHELDNEQLQIDDNTYLRGVGIGRSIVRQNADARTVRLKDNGSGNSGHFSFLTGLTIAGGNASSGGGVKVDSNAFAKLFHVAVVDNEATGAGGGVLVSSNGTLMLRDSVIANNRSDDSRGGAGLFGANSSQVDLGRTVIAHNTDLDGSSANPNYYHSNFGAATTSVGRSLIESLRLGLESSFEASDLLNTTPQFVVTTFNDVEITNSDDEFRLSLREAVVHANSASPAERAIADTLNGGQLIWLPSGYHTLTNAGSGGATEGDLNLTDSTIIQGVSIAHSLINVEALDLLDNSPDTVFPGELEWFSRADIVGGDTNNDGFTNASDIDAVTAAWGTENLDQTGDGQTNLADSEFMVYNHFETIPGDANLDQVVNGADFVIWNANRFQQGGWGQGDFNFDGEVNGADFVIWHNAFKSSSQRHLDAVPNIARPYLIDAEFLPSPNVGDLSALAPQIEILTSQKDVVTYPAISQYTTKRYQTSIPNNRISIRREARDHQIVDKAFESPADVFGVHTV